MNEIIPKSLIRASYLAWALTTIVGVQSWSANDETVNDLLRRMKSQNHAMGNKSTVPLPDSRIAPAIMSKPEIDLDSIKPPASTELQPLANSDTVSKSASDKDRGDLEKITDSQIREMYHLSEKLKNSPNRGEVWLRLAELYTEKANYLEYRKQSDFEKKLKAYNEKKLQNKPVIENGEAYQYRKKAIVLYEYFSRDFSNDSKMDQALYFLGFNHNQMGDTKRGNAYFAKLVQEYPKSPFIEEAYFSVADYYFEAGQWEKAYDSYQKVIRNKNSKVYILALYKAGWSLYKLKKAKQGLVYLETIIKLGNKREIPNASRLDGEARRDIVLFFAEGGDPASAANYFGTLLPDTANSNLEKLAYFYADKGNKDGAFVIFKGLLQKNPTAPKAFEYQYQIVNAYANQAKTDRFKEELYHLVKDFAPASAWYEENKGNNEAVTNSLKLRESFLRGYILQAHQTAQNSGGAYSQEQAIEGYKLYLGEFTQAPQYPDMKFYYGELLYDAKRLTEAVVQYQWVAINAPQSKYGQKAALNSVLVAEKDLPSEEQILKSVGGSTQVNDFDPRVKMFIQNGEWYVKNFANGEKIVELKFRMARIYYITNHFEDAEKYFRDIVKNHSKTKQAEYSANLLLDIYNLKKDYTGLEKVGQEMLANQDIAQTSSGSEIKTVLEKASFKTAEELEGQKDYQGAAKQYEMFLKGHSNSKLATTAHFNSAVNYDRAGLMLLALGHYEKVLKNTEPSHSGLRDKSQRNIAKIYQDLGLYEKAASAYLFAAENAGKDPAAGNFYYNAGVLFDALNHYDLAIKSYTAYQASKAPLKERNEILYKMAEIYNRKKELKKALEYYQMYVRVAQNQERTVEVYYKISELEAKVGSKKDAEAARERVVRVHRGYSPNLTGPGAKYAARIRLGEVEKTLNELRAIQFPHDAKKQKKVLTQKLSIMSKINKELGDVIKYDSREEVVGALTVLGRANQHMAESLLAAPVPKGLNAEELKMYKDGVKREFADPLIAKANDALKSAVDRARDLDVYNEYYYFALRAEKKPESELRFETAIPEHLMDWIGLGANSALDSATYGALNSAIAKNDEVAIEAAVPVLLGAKPNDTRALNALALTHFKRGRKGLAKMILAKLASNEALSPEEAAGVANNQAIIVQSDGEALEAIMLFKKTLQIKPSYSVAGANIGYIYTEARDYRKARVALETAYQASIKTFATLNNYAVSLMMENHDADVVFKEAYLMNSADVGFLINYASYLISNKGDKVQGKEIVDKLNFIGISPERRSSVQSLESRLKGNKGGNN